MYTTHIPSQLGPRPKVGPGSRNRRPRPSSFTGIHRPLSYFPFLPPVRRFSIYELGPIEGPHPRPVINRSRFTGPPVAVSNRPPRSILAGQGLTFSSTPTLWYVKTLAPETLDVREGQ